MEPPEGFRAVNAGALAERVTWKWDWRLLLMMLRSRVKYFLVKPPYVYKVVNLTMELCGRLNFRISLAELFNSCERHPNFVNVILSDRTVHDMFYLPLQVLRYRGRFYRSINIDDYKTLGREFSLLPTDYWFTLYHYNGEKSMLQLDMRSSCRADIKPASCNTVTTVLCMCSFPSFWDHIRSI